MKLFYKIYLFLIVILILIIAGSGYISYQRDITLLNNDMEKDAILLGKALAGMLEHAWRKSGKDMALKLIHDANLKERSVRIRWVDLSRGAAIPVAPNVAPEKLEAVRKGKAVSIITKSRDELPYRFTYVPIQTGPDFLGAIELSESLRQVQAYAHRSIVHIFMTALLLFLISGVLLWFHFYKWIHQPLVRFIEKSQRIGQGDLTSDLIVTGNDEFAKLGHTLNSMCEKLQESWDIARLENERRIEAIEQLRHAERLTTLGRLSAGMAHELGTPLNVISGRSKLIHSGDLNTDEIIDCARIIREQTARITKIMQNLLDFARRRKPNRTCQDIVPVIRNVLDMLTQTAHKAKVTFHFISHSAHSSVSFDVLQIQQVLTNLVLNGIQAMPGGGRLEVDVAVIEKRSPNAQNDAQKQWCAIRIMDDGAGVPADISDHIFEPFFTTKEVGKGTGLGLSIAYGIMHEHGGGIELFNRPDNGACFTIFLPLEEQ